MFISKKKFTAFVDSMKSLQNKFISHNPKNENNMKIKLLTIAAIAALFSKNTSEEIEPTQEDFQKINDELASRAQTIATLTTERDNLKTANDTLTATKTKAEADLATANTEIGTLNATNATLTTENTELKANPGTKPAAAANTGDPEAGKEKKIKLAANSDDFMTNLANVKKEYM